MALTWTLPTQSDKKKITLVSGAFQIRMTSTNPDMTSVLTIQNVKYVD